MRRLHSEADGAEAEAGAKPLVPPAAEQPARREHGDLAFPMFAAAAPLRRSPARIAVQLAESITETMRAQPLHAQPSQSPQATQDEEPPVLYGRVAAAGPYLNVYFERAHFLRQLLRRLFTAGDAYGTGAALAGQRVMIEFSSPNTNKPLHIGHLRNNVIGESLARIMAANGAEVCRVNLVNDRGIHICKSMCAYRKFGADSTPESTGMKPDHFVGTYYVRFNQWAAEDEHAEQEAREMLAAWEAEDPQVRALWKRMNEWAVSGMQQTYRDTGIEFDRIDWESKLYLYGKEAILRGLADGIFERAEDGSIWSDLAEIGLDRKVLLRSDGTALYLTQDIGAAIRRRHEWQFNRLIYVVASEQRYHFQVLFHLLRKLGFKWASELHHRSYGMVTLPEGKMKSREGIVIDADDLLATLRTLAQDGIESRGRGQVVADVAGTAHKIAIAALHYYLLQVDPDRDLNFVPSRSIGMQGDTGPYLQYVGARIASLLRQTDATNDNATNDDATNDNAPNDNGAQEIDYTLLNSDTEWEIALLLADWPQVVARAAEQLDPTHITGFLRDLGKAFSRYYHDVPLAVEPDPRVRAARLAMARAILQVLRNALHLAVIPFLETM